MQTQWSIEIIIVQSVIIFTLEQKKSHKSHVLDANLKRIDQGDSRLSVHPLRFVHDNCPDGFVFIRTNGRLGKNDKNKKQKKHPPRGDDASTVSAGTCRVGRGEQGEVRRAISALRGGPHVDLERFRLKIWSKIDFSIAEKTWPTHLYIYLLCEADGGP